jgi:branched-chain amino acid transport system ATP-binding protein/branched-chain amino acid transport system permease protein
MLPLPRPAVALVLAALLVAALVLPFFVGSYGVKFATRVLVLAIFVVSLDFLIGITGLVSFGHAMFFGFGAYAVYFVSPVDAPANGFVAFPLAILAAGALAAAIGAVAVLTRGFYFIMVTLAFGEMMFSLFHDTRFAGGSDGAYINVKPEFALGALTLVDLERRVAFYYVCLGLLVAAWLGLLALARGPFGRVLQGVRWNEARAGALGFNTYAYKLASFSVAGAVGGLAGALFATIDGYVTPDLFGWRQSGLAIMMVVLGGVGTLFGPILGAALYAGVEEVLKTASWVGRVADHWSLALGIFLIAAVLAAPRGLAGFLGTGGRAGRAAPPLPPISTSPEGRGRPRERSEAWAGEGLQTIGEQIVPPHPDSARKRAESDLSPLGRGDEARSPRAISGQGTGKAIAVERLTRRFGGLTAVDDVTLSLERNRVHGIIGPNGAGKTTFINLLSGALRPSAGRIVLDGEDVAGQPAYAMARRGVGRSYQITNVFLPFTVWENCLLAAQARRPSPFQLRSRGQAAQHAAIAGALAAAGLSARADSIAAQLSHGEQRQLEIAMLMASGARLLILDEPLAGMGPEETARVTALLRALAADHTVILIEHDIDAIFAAADTLTVLVGGRLLAHGAPEDVRRDPAVREAYLGNYGQAGAAG